MSASQNTISLPHKEVKLKTAVLISISVPLSQPDLHNTVLNMEVGNSLVV